MSPKHLSTAWVRLQYTFILELDYPLVNSVAAIAKFLLERKIEVESITVGPDEDNKLFMVLRCHLERDRLTHTMDLLSKIPSVLKIELAAPQRST